MATIIDGRAIAQDLEERIRKEIKRLSQQPRLAILSFNTPTSQVYLNAQLRVARRVGIEVHTESKTERRPVGTFGVGPLPWNVEFQEIQQTIEDWNQDPAVHGIFVHQPLPPQIDAQQLSALIDPRKDIEGIHPQHSARRFFARARIGSCTALAVMELIESTGVDLRGKEAVVVGHSEIVGRPVSMLLLDALATTTVCHLGTAEAGRLEEHVRRADVLVVAVGEPQIIKGAWIKAKAIVIDVGINVVGGHVVGDVEFDAAKERAAFISPVPGGVGPVTVMMVMKNTVEAFRLQHAAS
ncbi:MAG: bifunctional 5,10-methylenetetrahydrofolate dehydrogenase/5,10-methenyltetrahydrofolate cyclohydrolase [Candidatus Omnitrophica bacterium]|nr:bifunctional 5,10-methylenetetrahydrofolate dehydrogenase/5,10-methenyltetrahydrofolate cyclohydrolase [Candidatus Omnitrophota bacterium]